MIDMEGIKEIATAFYERASDHEKDLVEEFFRKLDVNGDGKISLPELKNNVESWLSNENVFNKLDENRDGLLEFFEVLPIYYLVNKVGKLVCCGCYGLLVGPYFSCFKCLENGDDWYDLCCQCYRGGIMEHNHSLDQMLDQHSLAMKLKNHAADGGRQSIKRKGEMEELREISLAYYEASPPEVQVSAHEFFSSMDTNGDGRVTLQEFLTFTKHQAHAQIRNPHFFTEIDTDGNGTLDFWEVVMLYYIIESGRPFCDCCGKFIPGIYFSCVECFKNSQNSHDICCDCYRSAMCDHNHNGVIQYLDNYTLLGVAKHSAISQATGVNQGEILVTSPSAFVPVAVSDIHTVSNATASGENNSNAVVRPSSEMEKWTLALRAAGLIFNIGNFAAPFMCTIM